MKIKFFSLGCKVNSYENDGVKQLLLDEGFSLCSHEEVPDVVVINTCSVTSTADQKSRQHIRKFKKNYPNAIIVVMGCYSQGNYEFISNEIDADIIIGTSKRNKIPEYIKSFICDHTKIVDIDTKPRLFQYESLGIVASSENVRAYLKIQDGCDNFCSYCLIPYRRGRSRSRELNEIILETKKLVEAGYKEIVLTGIHVGGYGKDLNGVTFSELVEKLSDIPSLFRLRISSIEASEIDDKLIHLIKTRKNIAKHLHIPIQSGSQTVLERMNRKYTAEEFVAKLIKIRHTIPNICLTTDVIVGFPGETDYEFKETVINICRSGFDMLHVFPFSPREGTKAFDMENQIDPQTKEKRVKRLLNLSKKLWEGYQEENIGKRVEILVEQYDAKKHLLKGHSSNYLELHIPSPIDLTGQIIKTHFKKS